MDKTILLTQEKHIATIHFNRPDAMNSLNETMADEFLHAITTLEKQDDIKLVILQGSGKTFMAGGDISFFYQHLNHIGEKINSIIEKVHKISQKLQSMNKIVLACVHGSVAGIGMSFMLTADLVIAAENTKFTMAYSKLGTSTDGGATYYLPRHLGIKKAMQLALLSEAFASSEAERLGLINWVVADTELENFKNKLADKIVNGPTIALNNIKHLIQQSFNNDLDAQLQAEQKAFVTAVQTEDFRQGVTAFINKEKPTFIGK